MESASFTDAVPFVSMVAAQFCDLALATVMKAAFNRGMSRLPFLGYSSALATALLLPLFIFRRNRGAPPLTKARLSRFFLLGLLGNLSQILIVTGIKFSSPTLSSAMSNPVPICTFLLAVIFRIEKLDFRKSSSLAKSTGTIVAVGGELIVTVYKGPAVLMVSNHSNVPHRFLVSEHPQWVLEGLLLAVGCLLCAIWNICQTATIKEYPEEMTVVFLEILFSTFQCMIFSLIAERGPAAWKLTSGIEIAAVVCMALIGSILTATAQTRCLSKRGQVYVAMLRPLGIAIAVVMTVLFLSNTLQLGSAAGSLVITAGLYSLLWGRHQEKNALWDETVISNARSSTGRTPLLKDVVDGGA